MAILKNGMSHLEIERAIVESGGRCTGGAEHFSGFDGPEWGVPCNFGKMRAHLWNRGLSFTTEEHGLLTGYRSSCGQEAVASARFPMFAPGNFERCKTCEKAQAKASQ